MNERDTPDAAGAPDRPDEMTVAPKPVSDPPLEAPGGKSMTPREVVIVGGGFAGLSCARALGRRGVEVTLIDRRNYHLFQPLLYQVATAALSPADVAQPIRRILSRHRSVDVIMAEVVGVDVAEKRVRLSGGKTVPYRRLVLAPGSTFDYFGHPEWEALAPGLKTIDDASAIRSTILSNFEMAETSLDPAEQKRLMTTVVVGGGPTGVEMAGSIAELCRWTLARDFRHIDPSSATVMLVEGMPRLLGGFPDALSDYARSALERLGVKVVTGQMVEDIRPGAITLAGEDIPVGMVIWGAGVRANPAAKWLGVEPADRSGRVAVGDDLAVRGLDGVHVLGDAALVMGDDGPLPGLAQVAKQQGEHLGRALAAAIGEGAAIPPFRFKDRGNTAVIGRNAAVFDFGERQLKGRFAWLLWAIVHVYLLFGREKRILVTIQWVWRYFTFQRGARIIR